MKVQSRRLSAASIYLVVFSPAIVTIVVLSVAFPLQQPQRFPLTISA